MCCRAAGKSCRAPSWLRAAAAGAALARYPDDPAGMYLGISCRQRRSSFPAARQEPVRDRYGGAGGRAQAKIRRRLSAATRLDMSSRDFIASIWPFRCGAS